VDRSPARGLPGASAPASRRRNWESVPGSGGREITYVDLARRLTDMGIRETEGSITVKINRGTFPVWFFLAALKAIGCPQMRLEDV
jgi:hypothetical protein